MKKDDVLFLILFALFIVSQILYMVTCSNYEELKSKIAEEEKIENNIETLGEKK